MRHGFLVILGICFSLQITAQEKQFSGSFAPVFKYKSDSIEYARLDPEHRQNFLTGKKYRMRMIVRQNRDFTPYQELSHITNKDSITKISIAGNNDRELPPGLSEYKNLESLELINFRLRKLPKDIAVKRLILYVNGPARRLRLPNNSTIRQLVIRGDEKNKLPRRYDRLKSLESLQLSWNQMKKFPNVKGCDSLKTLDLNNNDIQRISQAVAGLKRLENLSLYNNDLKEIPPFLYTMQSLRIIDFYYNHLTNVSPAIAKLKNLEIIYLANNELRELPDEIGELKNLWALYVHHNLLTSLPSSVRNMASLSILRVNNNNLTQWPEGVTALKGLTNFDCSFNLLQTLPVNELDYPNMKLIALSGNPWDPKVKLDLQAWANKQQDKDVVIILEGIMGGK